MSLSVYERLAIAELQRDQAQAEVTRLHLDISNVTAAYEDAADRIAILEAFYDAKPPWTGTGICRYCGEQVRLWMHPTGWVHHPHASECVWLLAGFAEQPS